MREIIDVVGPFLTIISLIAAVIVNAGTIRQRKKDPVEKWKSGLEEWRINVNEDLADFKIGQKRMWKVVDSHADASRFMLRALKGILSHLPDVPREEAEKIECDIDNYLINR